MSRLKFNLSAIISFLMSLGLAAPAGSAETPENLAPKATVSANSEYSGDYAAKFAVDGLIPGTGSKTDARQVWCCNGARANGQAEFVLHWEKPVAVAEIVYWGRPGFLPDSWKEYEVYFDQDSQPAAKGCLRMSHGPHRIEVARPQAQTIRLKFLSSYGGPNPGAAEIAVYSSRPSEEQLDWFPLAGRKLEERIHQAEQESAPLRQAASTIPGQVVFLSGTRPYNSVDWTTPVVAPATPTEKMKYLGYGQEGQTYRCYIEKDSPGPATMGHQLHLLDPAQPQSKPRLLLDAGSGWIGGAMSVSYDGASLYFAMAPEGDPFFHLYRLAVTGGKPEQLTRGTFQDVDPEILPDGRIVFCSTRFGSREEYHGYLVSTLFTMGPQGENIQPLTYHVVNDHEPRVTASGSIVFVRQDNFFMNGKIETQIHQIHADGKGGTVLLGQDRQGSGYDRATAHEQFPKAIGFLSPSQLNFKRNGNAFGCPAPLPDGRVAALCSPAHNWSPDYPFKKNGIGIVISSAGLTTDGQAVDTSEALHDISALPDGRLLCSTLDKKTLGIVDLKSGKVTRFYSSNQALIHSPLYVGPRPKPAVMTTATTADTGNATGFFYCQNLFNTKQVHADLKRIKAVRLLEARPLTIRMLACNDYQGGVNHIGTEAVELGVVPLFPDGSFFIEAPADRALAFQAIDAEGRAVINEMTWIYTRPGEHRSCVGCHSGRAHAPEQARGKALEHPPVRLTGEATPFRYKANTLAHGGVTGTNFDRIRETKSINLYPYPSPRSAKNAPPLPAGRATTVQTLCELLRKGTAAEKMSAAHHLGILRDRAAVPALITALTDDQSGVRLNAALALASCGNRLAVDGLLKTIQDPDLQVALAGRIALAHLTGHSEELKDVQPADRAALSQRWKEWLAKNDWTAIEQQQIELLKSSDPELVIQAIQTLGHIGADPAREALRNYAQHGLDLKDQTDLQAQLDALRGLGQLHDPKAVALFKSVLATHLSLPKKERSAKLSEAAVEALGRIGTPEAATVLIDAIPQLKRFWEYNLALGDQGGGWGDYLSDSPVHYRFLEAFDAMGVKLTEANLFVMINSLHMSFDQPLLLEPDTYETLLARVAQRSGCLDTVLDSCFAMIEVEPGPVNDAFRKSVVEEVYTHNYPQMNGKKGEAFTIPQRVAYILSVFGIRPEDAPRYQRVFRKYHDRFQSIRKEYRGLETGACAWICFYSLETLGKLELADAYNTFQQALTLDPAEAADGLPDAAEHIAHFSATPHYRAAAAYGLGQLGKHEAVATLLATLTNFENALEVRHTAARALVKLCDGSDLKVLRETAAAYPEVVTRRVLLRACDEAERRAPPAANR